MTWIIYFSDRILNFNYSNNLIIKLYWIVYNCFIMGYAIFVNWTFSIYFCDLFWKDIPRCQIRCRPMTPINRGYLLVYLINTIQLYNATVFDIAHLPKLRRGYDHKTEHRWHRAIVHKGFAQGRCTLHSNCLGRGSNLYSPSCRPSALTTIPHNVQYGLGLSLSNNIRLGNIYPLRSVYLNIYHRKKLKLFCLLHCLTRLWMSTCFNFKWKLHV